MGCHDPFTLCHGAFEIAKKIGVASMGAASVLSSGNDMNIRTLALLQVLSVNRQATVMPFAPFDLEVPQ